MLAMIGCHRQPGFCEGGTADRDPDSMSKAWTSGNAACGCCDPPLTSKAGVSKTVSARPREVAGLNRVGKLEPEEDTNDSGRLPVRASWKESVRLEVCVVNDP